MPSVEREREEFLQKFHELTKGDPNRQLDPFKVGRQIGMNGDQTRTVVSFLVGKDWLKGHILQSEEVGLMHLTVPGIEEVERIKTGPDIVEAFQKAARRLPIVAWIIIAILALGTLLTIANQTLELLQKIGVLR